MRTIGIDSWMFLLDDHAEGWRKQVDESAYRPVRVPHDWAVEHDFDPSCSSGTGYLPGGVGWYRAHCSIKDLALDRAAAVRLIFHGVYKNAQVYLNGYHLGRRPSGYAEFSFDVTEFISYATDDDLVISVRVDHRDLADSRWYNGSGITRRVELQTHEDVSIAPHGTTVTTLSADHQAARVRIEQRLVNHTDHDQRVVVEHTLVPAGPGESEYGHRSEHVLVVAAGGTADLDHVADLAQPRLWSDLRPDLYRLLTKIKVVGESDQVGHHEQIIGIRTFAFDPDAGFLINGDRRILKGVCLHEDAGPLGTAVPAEVWLRRLVQLRAGGVNAVRMAHNPHSPELYALCDLLGFYVIDEAFDEWENPKNKWWQGHNVYPPKHQGYAHDYPEWHRRDLEAMIDAHKNHPSVIAWSIGNEIDYPNDPYVSELFDQMTGNNDADKPAAERAYDPSRPDIRRLTTLARELVDIVRARDASRPITMAAAFPELSSRTGLVEELDLLSYNYKEQLYAEDHDRFPKHPLLGSETSHSYRAWRQVTDVDYVAGQFLWTGVDFLGETVGWPSHGSSAGLLTTAGFAKERWHLRRSWWSETDVLRIAVRAEDSADRDRFDRVWTPQQRVEVACFTNAADVRLSQGGDPIALTFDDERGFWCAIVTAGSGLFRAEATRDGRRLVDELHPPSPAVELVVTPWVVPAAWRAGVQRLAGPDRVHQLECRLLDANGRTAREAREVAVTVGHGELLGIDNGDLRDPTSYRLTHRSTCAGRLIVYVRGAGATVSLRAAGLPEVVLQTDTSRPD